MNHSNNFFFLAFLIPIGEAEIINLIWLLKVSPHSASVRLCGACVKGLLYPSFLMTLGKVNIKGMNIKWVNVPAIKPIQNSLLFGI